MSTPRTRLTRPLAAALPIALALCLGALTPAHAAARACAAAGSSAEATIPGSSAVAAPARTRGLARGFAASSRVSVSFCYRRAGRGSRRVVALGANRFSLVDRGAGRLVARSARGQVRMRGSARRWNRVTVLLDAASGRLTVRVGRSTRSLRGAVAERHVRLGAGRTASKRLRFSGVAIRTVGAAGAAKPAPAEPTSGNVWRQLVAGAPLDALSSAYVAELRRQVTGFGPWMNTWHYSAPVYTVPGDQPTVRVALDTTARDLQEAFAAVPVPAGARAADGSDQNMVVSQPATDSLWEFWHMHKVAGAWHARWGGRMSDVSRNPGYFEAPHSGWGASASSLSVLDGLIRVSELQAGRIDHALALAIPQARAKYYSWPAQRTDGRLDSPTAIPEGARFRLDPALDLEALHLSPYVHTLAVAAQRYGIIVRDQAGAVSFFGEDPAGASVDPYPAILGPAGASTQLKTFPWDRLQALKTDLRS